MNPKTLPAVALTFLMLGTARATPTPAESLYSVKGSDPSFAEVLASGAIKPGERFSKGPVTGSHVDVNNELLEKQTGRQGPIARDIGLHTQGSGGIKRKDFPKWTRWYQEDGNTQVYRLFKDEQNIRSGAGQDGTPGRVETYSRGIKVIPGAWHEWQAVYTIIKPHDANIFQLFHEGHLWAFHIRMSDEGDIFFHRRRKEEGLEQEISLAKAMTGKSIAFKVRANAVDYELYRKDPIQGDWELVTKGSYARGDDDQISFRWGMYSGSKKGFSIKHDAMLLVTGATYQ